jgi:hypothetical protein
MNSIRFSDFYLSVGVFGSAGGSSALADEPSVPPRHINADMAMPIARTSAIHGASGRRSDRSCVSRLMIAIP